MRTRVRAGATQWPPLCSAPAAPRATRRRCHHRCHHRCLPPAPRSRLRRRRPVARPSTRHTTVAAARAQRPACPAAWGPARAGGRTPAASGDERGCPCALRAYVGRLLVHPHAHQQLRQRGCTPLARRAQKAPMPCTFDLLALARRAHTTASRAAVVTSSTTGGWLRGRARTQLKRRRVSRTRQHPLSGLVYVGKGGASERRARAWSSCGGVRAGRSGSLAPRASHTCRCGTAPAEPLAVHVPRELPPSPARLRGAGTLPASCWPARWRARRRARVRGSQRLVLATAAAATMRRGWRAQKSSAPQPVQWTQWPAWDEGNLCPCAKSASGWRTRCPPMATGASPQRHHRQSRSRSLLLSAPPASHGRRHWEGRALPPPSRHLVRQHVGWPSRPPSSRTLRSVCCWPGPPAGNQICARSQARAAAACKAGSRRRTRFHTARAQPPTFQLRQVGGVRSLDKGYGGGKHHLSMDTKFGGACAERCLVDCSHPPGVVRCRCAQLHLLARRSARGCASYAWKHG